MSKSTEDLIAAAISIKSRAYAPYSNHPVGAAILDEQGRIHAGCNVENAAYPQGVCAEAAAISSMISITICFTSSSVFMFKTGKCLEVVIN